MLLKRVLMCGLFMYSAVKSDEAANEALCDLLKFRPQCRAEGACSKSSINGTLCGVKFNGNKEPELVSASRAASKYYEAGYGTVDTALLGNLKTVKSLYLYESGLTKLDDSVSSLTSLKTL